MIREKENQKGSQKKVLLFFVLLVAIGITLALVDYNRTINFPNSRDDQKVRIEITEGESVNGILESLLEGELLTKKNYYYTKLYLKINNLGTNLQAGVYELPRNLTIVELIDTLQFGRSEEVWVTIPEGLRKDEIATIISRELNAYDSSNFSREEFLNLTTNRDFITNLGLIEDIDNLEGFLFPDKYSLPKEVTTEEVIIKMVENFKTKVGEEYTYEDIIFASIVEREGYNADDRPIIAGIILKRFDEGWLLQTDATLLYPVRDWKHTITIQDKEDDNPYNTYRRIGIPPTPICNPGIQSVSAVWNPTKTDYYYYIHDPDGNPHYARTLEEHNANVNKYLR
jgi:UPF0755 protein